MQTFINVSSTKSFEPALGFVLHHLDASLDFHSALAKRPPQGQWSSAISSISNRIARCSDALEGTIRQSSISEEIGDEYEKLLRELKDLYLGFSTFEAVCEEIVLCISHPSKPRESPLFKKFGARKKGLNQVLGRAASAIKHRDAQLRPLLVTSQSYNQFVVLPCFYLEGYNSEQDALGPDPSVHIGGNSAFSALRQIRYYFVHLYFLAHWIEESLPNRVTASSASTNYKTPDKVGQDLERVARFLANSSRFVMPNEFGRNQPDVEFEQRRGECALRLSYASSSRFKPLERGTFKANAVADGYTRKIMLPYAGSNVMDTWRQNSRLAH